MALACAKSLNAMILETNRTPHHPRTPPLLPGSCYQNAGFTFTPGLYAPCPKGKRALVYGRSLYIISILTHSFSSAFDAASRVPYQFGGFSFFSLSPKTVVRIQPFAFKSLTFLVKAQRFLCLSAFSQFANSLLHFTNLQNCLKSPG